MIKLNFLIFASIFCTGWILGTICVITFFIFDNDDDVLHERKYSRHDFLRSTHKTMENEGNARIDVEFEPKVSLFRRNSKNSQSTLTLANSRSFQDTENKYIFDKIPTFQFKRNDSSNLIIILDWPVDDKLFTVENFKSLESLLDIYPQSRIRCILATSSDAYNKKISRHLSIGHFEKYKRRNYDIEVVPFNKMTRIHSHQGSLISPYWQKYGSKCCGQCNSTICESSISHNLQPYHVLTFIRLAKLWRSGGIFSDFSFLFLAPIPPEIISQGFFMHSHCMDINFLEKWQIEELKIPSNSNSSSATPPNTNCVTSTLLIFHTPKSEILLCVLKMYEDIEFVTCLEQDLIFGGAKCISEAFNSCTSTHGGGNNIRHVLETFGNDPIKASEVFHSKHWKLNRSTRILWLGDLAWQGKWAKFSDRNDTLLASVVSQIHLHKSEYEDRSNCQKNCSHYSVSPTILRESEMTSSVGSYNTGMEETACAPSIVIPRFLNTASSFLFSALTNHPLVLPPLNVGVQSTGTATGSCYNSNTGGLSHKEQHQIKPFSLANRMWCFPFIDELESFTTVDGNIVYESDMSLPTLMFQDNPNLKALFVVRHPVDRMYSSYSKAYEEVVSMEMKMSFDNLTSLGYAEYSKYSSIRKMLSNESSIEEDIIQHYFNKSEVLHAYSWNTNSTTSTAVSISSSEERLLLDSLFMQSMYYPAILYYFKVLGANNVMVIDSDDLDIRNSSHLQQTMNTVFEFLNLCPFNISHHLPITNRGNYRIPADHKMSQDMYKHLANYFAPFNDALSELTGVNFTHWNVRLPPETLPLFSTDVNSSSFEKTLWFETEDIPLRKSRSGIMSHLLPKRKSQEDSGFNTTLGMLISF